MGHGRCLGGTLIGLADDAPAVQRFLHRLNGKAAPLCGASQGRIAPFVQLTGHSLPQVRAGRQKGTHCIGQKRFFVFI